MDSKIEMKIEPIQEMGTESVEKLLEKIEFLTNENTRIFKKFKTEKRKNNRLRKKIKSEKGLVDEWISIDDN
jgi:hypothetical protein